MRGQPRSSAAVELLARAGLPPSSVAGVRMALESGRGRTAVPVRTTLLAAVVGVAAVAAALTITASADRLLGTPRLYGHNWDAVIGNGTDPSYPKRFVDRLRADRSIAQLAGGTVDEARVGGRPTGVLAMDQLRGSLSPTLVEGRAPAAVSEIVLGTKTARALRVEIGDEVEGRIGDRSLAFRVVGRGVLPEVGVAGLAPLGLGQGVAMTFEALRRLNPRASRNVFLLGLAAGADRHATLARLERDASAARAEPARRRRQLGARQRLPLRARGADRGGGRGRARPRARHLDPSPPARPRDPEDAGLRAPRRAADGRLAGDDGRGDRPPRRAAARGGARPLRLEPVRDGARRRPRAVAPVWPGLLVIPATLLLANLVALVPGRIAAGTRPAVVLRAE